MREREAIFSISLSGVKARKERHIGKHKKVGIQAPPYNGGEKTERHWLFVFLACLLLFITEHSL